MNKMYLVGNLQDYGGPYSSLLLNKEDGSLYILVRADSVYLLAPVSASEISDYMSGSVNLQSIFKDKDPYEAIVNGSQILLVPMQNNIASMIGEEEVFDPEFCFDKMKLKVFLKRFNAGAYSTSGRVAN